jgi:membrane carboxypeptidase/penicillin-binding protein PbpC
MINKNSVLKTFNRTEKNLNKWKQFKYLILQRLPRQMSPSKNPSQALPSRNKLLTRSKKNKTKQKFNPNTARSLLKSLLLETKLGAQKTTMKRHLDKRN